MASVAASAGASLKQHITVEPAGDLLEKFYAIYRLCRSACRVHGNISRHVWQPLQGLHSS